MTFIKYFKILNLLFRNNSTLWTRCGSRIWSGGGPQLLRPKVADIAKQSRASEASILQPGSRARLSGPWKTFGFLMLKYAFSCILETLFLLFLTCILTPKVDKNRALNFTSINLRHSDMLHLFFNLHEKVMLWLNDLRYAEWRETKNFMTWVVKNRSIVWLITHCFSLIPQSMSSKWKFTFKNR